MQRQLRHTPRWPAKRVQAGRLRAKLRLKEARLTRDGSPAHDLVSSELHFYKENLRYLAVLPEERLAAEHLDTVWSPA